MTNSDWYIRITVCFIKILHRWNVSIIYKQINCLLFQLSDRKRFVNWQRRSKLSFLNEFQRNLQPK